MQPSHKQECLQAYTYSPGTLISTYLWRCSSQKCWWLFHWQFFLYSGNHRAPAQGVGDEQNRFQNSDCNHGSGCGRSMSSAPGHKLMRTGGHWIPIQGVLVFCFLLQVIQAEAEHCVVAGAPSSPTYTFHGSLGDCGGGGASVYLISSNICVMTFVNNPSLDEFLHCWHQPNPTLSTILSFCAGEKRELYQGNLENVM